MTCDHAAHEAAAVRAVRAVLDLVDTATIVSAGAADNTIRVDMRHDTWQALVGSYAEIAGLLRAGQEEASSDA